MKFYDLVVEYIMQVQGAKGSIKQKKITQRYLVKAKSCQDASNIFKQIYDKVMGDYNIKSVRETKYIMVINDGKRKPDNKEQLVDQMLEAADE